MRRRFFTARRRKTWKASAFGLLFGLLATAPVGAASVTYTYDALGRLTQVIYDDGKTITYAYDEAGNRVIQSVTQN